MLLLRANFNGPFELQGRFHISFQSSFFIITNLVFVLNLLSLCLLRLFVMPRFLHMFPVICPIEFRSISSFFHPSASKKTSLVLSYQPVEIFRLSAINLLFAFLLMVVARTGQQMQERCQFFVLKIKSS